MFDSKSDYAPNKRDPDAIVCKSVTGVHIRLTRADFSSVEEFLTWKAWSDENFHAEELDNHAYSDNTISLSAVYEAQSAAPLPEEELERRDDRRQRLRYTAEAVAYIQHILTDKQYRRLWMYCVDGHTEEQIATIESVAQQCISKSLIAAKKKQKNFFKVLKTGRKNRCFPALYEDS